MSSSHTCTNKHKSVLSTAGEVFTCSLHSETLSLVVWNQQQRDLHCQSTYPAALRSGGWLPVWSAHCPALQLHNRNIDWHTCMNTHTIAYTINRKYGINTWNNQLFSEVLKTKWKHLYMKYIQSCSPLLAPLNFLHNLYNIFRNKYKCTKFISSGSFNWRSNVI